MIPFDFATQCFDNNLPTAYAVTVSYSGRDSLPRQEIKCDLDLNHFKDLVIEDDVHRIGETLQLLSSNFFQYTEYFKGLLQNTNDISNVLSRNLARTTYVLQQKENVDIMVRIKEFVLMWTLGYDKDQKLLRPFLFDLRSKCLSLSEQILPATANGNGGDLDKLMQDIGVKLCKLGNMRLAVDGYVVAHAIQGTPIEEFNDLGDGIITDIRNLLQKIEETKENSLIP